MTMPKVDEDFYKFNQVEAPALDLEAIRARQRLAFINPYDCIQRINLLAADINDLIAEVARLRARLLEADRHILKLLMVGGTDNIEAAAHFMESVK